MDIKIREEVAFKIECLIHRLDDARDFLRLAQAVNAYEEIAAVQTDLWSLIDDLKEDVDHAVGLR